ncbi:alpha carbonic anhydrase 1, chloroplastic-like isoform X3 [Gossypium hirsutum]|uniref:Alpha carbonic anhydrase 1, chloroplastic-like isoform X3 n=1 Tax=Gossypium hirsutum TaxID=3635 RepID=A0ABM3BJK8_GOSHI|nr:alpha carbonic anhydrase 1, chloroplastic-like isoform X3 [Gossypium hirsutum]
MAPQHSIFFVLSLLLGISSAIDVIKEMEFCYSDNDGLDKWGKLDPTFSPCSSGQRQSPINIQRNLTVHNKLLKPLTRNYKHVHFEEYH